MQLAGEMAKAHRKIIEENLTEMPDDKGRSLVIGRVRFVFERAKEFMKTGGGELFAMPSSWSCEPTDSVVILSYDSIACA